MFRNASAGQASKCFLYECKHLPDCRTTVTAIRLQQERCFTFAFEYGRAVEIAKYYTCPRTSKQTEFTWMDGMGWDGDGDGDGDGMGGDGDGMGWGMGYGMGWDVPSHPIPSHPIPSHRMG